MKNHVQFWKFVLIVLCVSYVYAACKDDDYENNDSTKQATSISVGHTLFGMVSCPNDPDYFKVKIDSSTKSFVARLTFFQQTEENVIGDLDMDMMEKDGSIFGRSTGTDNMEEIGITVKHGTTYYLSVYGGQSNGSIYQLEIIKNAPACNQTSSCESSPSIPSTLSLTTCTISCTDFTLPTSNNSPVSAHLAHDFNQGDIELYLYDNVTSSLLDSTLFQEKRYIQSVTGTGSGILSISYDINSIGTPLVLKMLSLNRALMSSVLYLRNSCQKDSFEYDTKTNGTVVSVGDVIQATLCVQDVDYFRFTPSVSGTYLFQTINFHAFSSFKLILYNGNTILSTSSGQWGVQRISSQLTAGTEYAAAVSHQSQKDFSDYEFSLTTSTQCISDIFEPNDDISSAFSIYLSNIKPSVTFEATLCTNDKDYYLLIHQEETTLIDFLITVRYDATEGDMNITAQYPGGQIRITESYLTPGSATFKIQRAPANQNYYMILSNPMGAGFAYNFTVDITSCVDPDLDNSFTTAAEDPKSLPALSTNHYANLCAQYTEDWFALPKIDLDTMLSVQIDFSTELGDYLFLEIYHRKNIQKKILSSEWTTANFQRIILHGQQDGLVARVYSPVSAWVPYNMTLLSRQNHDNGGLSAAFIVGITGLCVVVVAAIVFAAYRIYIKSKRRLPQG